MAQLRRLREAIQDSLGNALLSVSVEVRRQGATVSGDQSGTSPFTVTVNDPGAILASDTVQIGTGSTTYNVNSVTSTTVVLSGFGGTLNVSDDDRLTPTNNLPILYEDSQGGETKTNPLTTDSNGMVRAWAEGSFYDLKVSGGLATTTLIQDAWVSTETGIRYVREARYGARGNGTSDDTTPIQNALDALGHVALPPGNYLVGTLYAGRGNRLSGIVDHPNTGSTLPTAPLYATWLKAKDSLNNSVIKSTNLRPTFTLGVDDANMHGLVIENLRIDGNKANNSSGHGLHIGGTGFYTSIRDLHISNCAGDGLHLGDSTLSPYVSCDVMNLSNIRVNDCVGTGIYCEGSSGFVALKIDSCKVDNSLAGIKITGLPNTGTAVGNRMNMVQIINCRFEANASGGSANMQNGITLDELRGAQVLIMGVKFWFANGLAQRTGNAINVSATSTGVVPNLMIINADQMSNAGTPMYAKMYDDGSAAAAAITDGPIAFFSNTIDSSTISNYFSRQFDVRTYSGDRGLVVQDWSETQPRVQMASQGGIYGIHFGGGSGAIDTNIYRQAANSLKTDDAFVYKSEVSVASQAALDATSTQGNFWNVTGTTNITSITTNSSDNGRVLVLRFSGALTVTDGSNLKLAGNFTTVADYTMTLIGNGTNWYELARSTN